MTACHHWTSGGVGRTVAGATAAVLLLAGCGDRQTPKDPALTAAIAACDTLAGFAARSSCWAHAIRNRDKEATP